MQYVIELLPKHHLLHRSEVPEFVVSIDGGFMPAIDRSDLCVRISSTAAPGTKILLEIDKPGGTHEERTVAIAQNGRVVTHINSLTTGGNTTDVRVYAFGADTIGASFKGYMNAPSGC